MTLPALTASELEELQFLAESAARLGGSILRSWESRFTVKEKSRANLVTEADFASQIAIHDFLIGKCPDHNFLGEEEQKTVRTDSPFQWIVDPLDGTSNYVHGFPYYAVSVGLEYGGQLVVGTIYDPTRDDLFHAALGQGSHLNGKRLRVADDCPVSEAMCIASLPTAGKANDLPARRFLNVLGEVQTVQRTGSAALNLAYLAAGRIEAFWSSSLKPWDMAAGALLVTEAGGILSNIAGGAFDVHKPEVLAANCRRVHDGVRQLLDLPT